MCRGRPAARRSSGRARREASGRTGLVCQKGTVMAGIGHLPGTSGDCSTKKREKKAVP